MAVLSETVVREVVLLLVALAVVMIRHDIMRHMNKLVESSRPQGLDKCEGSS